MSSEEISVRAHLLRFLGLGTQVAKQTEPEVAEQFDSPRDMLECPRLLPAPDRSKNGGGTTGFEAGTDHAPPDREQPGETPAQTQTSAAATPPPRPPESGEPVHSPALLRPIRGLRNTSREHFSLLVSSMKEAENAQRLLEQLRAKGYSPRIETVTLGGSGRWNRVLIGYLCQPRRSHALRR